jgi:WD40 repeat protein
MVRLWAADGTLIRVITVDPGQVVGAVLIAPDGTWFATGGADGKVRTWDRDGHQLATISGPDGELCALGLAPNGSWLATGDDDGIVRTWGTDGTPLSKSSISHKKGISCLEIAPDGTWLATGGVHDGKVRIWADDGLPELSRVTP